MHLFIHIDTVCDAANLGQTGKSERSHWRQLGGNPVGGMDDWVVSVTMITANRLPSSSLKPIIKSLHRYPYFGESSISYVSSFIAAFSAFPSFVYILNQLNFYIVDFCHSKPVYK